MGSCFSTSKTFSGEGRTLNEPSAAARLQTNAAPSGGQRLGGAAPSQSPTIRVSASSGTTRATDAEREARAKAAERRMNQQAAKGTPGHGKLSQQLEQQKGTNPRDAGEQDGPQRVVWD